MEPGAEPNRPERRGAARFPLAIPVVLPEGRAVTRDVSLSGVFLETDHSYAPGEQVSLVLVLERLSPDRPVRLQCEGRVVRVSRSGTKAGVAVALISYRFGAQGAAIELL